MLFRHLPTPCIGICSTTFGDSVCRGCRRYLHEIVDWNRYSEEEKRLVWLRLEGLMTQVMPAYFEIEDAELLFEQMRRLRMDTRNRSTPWSQLHALLRASARQEPVLEHFGVRRLDLSERSLAELRDHINTELYHLACAYYEKDHLRARRVVPAP
jgi:predicted Fe-S protein YdhL (DUF1289 family)